jgi:hypothetical protein
MSSNSGHVQLFAATATAPVRWRLLSGNNRDSGRGTESFTDAESCRVAIKALQVALDEVDPSLRRSATNQWVWQVTYGDRVVAVSGRGFDRLIRCEQGLAQFLLQLRDAEIGATLMISNARRW